MKPSVSTDYFDRALHKFIFEGVNSWKDVRLEADNIRRGNENFTAGKGLIVSFQQISEHRNYPNHSHSYFLNATTVSQVVEVVYMVQFYREGAKRAAQLFSDFIDSHYGINYAATSIVDGKIYGGNVYTPDITGKENLVLAKYTPIPSERVFDIPRAELKATQSADGVEDMKSAKFSFFSCESGKLQGVFIRDGGEGYSIAPSLTVDDSFLGADVLLNSDEAVGDVSLAWPSLSFRGAGFTIQRPITINRIDGFISQHFEPRTVITMEMQYIREWVEPYSERVQPSFLGIY